MKGLSKSITEQLDKKITSDMEEKHWKQFTQQSMYRGNGVYSINGELFSTNTRELFLMFCAVNEGIPYTKI